PCDESLRLHSECLCPYKAPASVSGGCLPRFHPPAACRCRSHSAEWLSLPGQHHLLIGKFLRVAVLQLDENNLPGLPGCHRPSRHDNPHHEFPTVLYIPSSLPQPYC